MKKTIKGRLLAAGIVMISMTAKAQLSTNPDKFLGNITTGWNSDMDTDGYIFSDYWNQVTPENATKWGSVEGDRQGKYNWGGADKAAKYAKEHGFPFKFHTLVWGSQYPKWMDNLSTEKQYEAIVEWMDEAKKHYPDLPVIDVVNEAVSGHAPAPYKAALGGDGKTGYDWIIKAFEMAHERWPDAILVYNDYNTFQWNTDQFIDLVRTIRDAGAPVDAYGCQSHDLTGCSASTLKASMKKIQDALKMPMYVTEYDIGTANDNDQLRDYKAQIPLLWEADYCAGVTLWGWIYGKTWTTDGNSGLIKNKKERPAMEWLREYMQTDAAKTAKSPYPGGVKEASVYVGASALNVEKGEKVGITIDIRLKTKGLENVELFVNGEKNTTLFSECILVGPGERNFFEAEYTPTEEGKYEIKAVVTADDGTQYERYAAFTAYGPRTPYNGVKQIPGIIEAEDFDSGAEGYTFHDSDHTNEGDVKNYRTDGDGVDFVKGNNGTVIGYTAQGEWLEYTINVTEAGKYEYEATVSAGNDNAGFTLSLVNDNGTTQLAKVNVPKTGDGDWSKYKTVKGKLSQPLEAGEQILRLTIDGAYANIDKIALRRVSDTPIHADADPNFHVYLCFGQSNMEGNAQWETVDKDVDERFQMLATTDFDNPKRTLGKWYTANCPIVNPIGKLGLSDYFGRTMVAASPSDVKIGVVAVAMGGSPIEMFDKDLYEAKLKANSGEWWAQLAVKYYGGNPYQRLIDMAKLAQEKGVIKGILLHQGCSNNGNPNWPTMVKKIYNDILTDLGLDADDVPLFAGETKRQDMGGGCYHHNAVVAKLPEVIPTAHVVSSENIPGNGTDAWHFSALGYRIFGKRYAFAALQTAGQETKANADYMMPENLKNFFTPTAFEKDLTAKSGSLLKLKLTGIFADKHREDLTTEATFSSTDYTITDGKIRLGEEGSTGTVTAVFTDFFGTKHTITLNITAGEPAGFTDLTSADLLTTQDFYIIGTADNKMFYGIDNQNLGYEEADKVLDNQGIVGCMFRAEQLSDNTYLLRLIQLNGMEYSIWGNPGYLNSQPTDGWCSFILGLNGQDGQDIKDGAVWEILYVEGKGFTLKNIGTGLYLHDAAPAKYEDPAYFSLCVPKGATAITAVKSNRAADDAVYSLQGIKVGTKRQWEALPHGIYIVNGKKMVKK